MEKQFRNWHYVPFFSHPIPMEIKGGTAPDTAFGRVWSLCFSEPRKLFLFDPDETGVEEFATSKKATELSGRMRPQTFAAAPGWGRLGACTVASFNLSTAPQTAWHQNLPRWQNSAAPSLRKSSGYAAAAAAGHAAKLQRQSVFECNQTWVSAPKAGQECQEDNLSASRRSGPRARQHASLHRPTRPPPPASVQENAGSF